MNAIVLGAELQASQANLVIDWTDLTVGFNSWRGECLHHFAQAEAAVSAALVALSREPDATVVLPHLIGSRYDELDRALMTSEAADRKAALLALRCFRKHDKLRVFLCHGVATLLASQTGEWHAVVNLLAFRNGAAVHEELFLSRSRAATRFETLRVEGQRLGQKLTALMQG